MSTGEVVTAIVSGLGVVASGLAAFFAWRSWRKRPKFKFYLQDEPAIMYKRLDDNEAYVYCWLANVGKAAAHNVNGWLKYGDDPPRVRPVTDAHTGVTDTTD